MALGFSPHLPVSVCGTGAWQIQTAFLATEHRGLPYYKFGPFRPGQPTPGFGYLYVSAIRNKVATEFQPYVHRLRLPASP